MIASNAVLASQAHLDAQAPDILGSDEMIVDLFAGGGGASTAVKLATGRHPDVAVNHDPNAVALHAANDPLLSRRQKAAA